MNYLVNPLRTVPTTQQAIDIETQYHPTQASQCATPKWQIDKICKISRSSVNIWEIQFYDYKKMLLSSAEERAEHQPEEIIPKPKISPPVRIHGVNNYGERIKTITKTMLHYVLQ